MASDKMLIGIFRDRANAEAVITDLEESGYNPKDISIVMKDRAVGRAIANDTGATMAEGAIGGAATGGLIGGLAGLLVGIGAIAIPGLGALLIGGPLAAALGLTGAAATTATGAITGALAGGLIGALVSLGVPEEDARVYDREIREGAILLAVPVSLASEARARTILDDHDATNIRSVNATDPAGRPAIGPNAYNRPVGYAGGMAYTNYTDPNTNVFQSPEAMKKAAWAPTAKMDALFANITYPTNKHDLIRNAVRYNADDTTLEMLERLPDNRVFASQREVYDVLANF